MRVQMEVRGLSCLGCEVEVADLLRPTFHERGTHVRQEKVRENRGIPTARTDDERIGGVHRFKCLWAYRGPVRLEPH